MLMICLAGAVADAPTVLSLPTPDDVTMDVAGRRVPAKRITPRPGRPVRTPGNEGGANPVVVGLAAAGAAAGGVAVGGGATLAIGLVGLGVLASQPTAEVTLALVILGGIIGLATPFLAAFAAGAAVLLLNEGAVSPDEWTGLLGCAASGYCFGLSLLLGSVLGSGIGCGSGNFGQIPGADRPAEWTAAGTVGGLVVGGLAGVLGGFLLNSDRNTQSITMLGGGVGGAAVGAALGAGLVGGIAAAASN